MKQRGEKITALTAYDFVTAALLERAGVDIALVGDSLGMVALGYESTVPVTLREMIHHCKAVRRATHNAFVIGDMPFLSYQVSPEEAVRNAGRFIKEGGCDAVKIEGGLEAVPAVAALTRAGMAVMGHVGLTPQSAVRMGGYRVQGRDEDSAQRILDAALALEQAGCVLMVLEAVPEDLAARVTEALEIPTLGIGAGVHCDGQVLVLPDLLGLGSGPVPKFVKKYANLGDQAVDAIERFCAEVKGGEFPTDAHSYHSTRSDRTRTSSSG